MLFRDADRQIVENKQTFDCLFRCLLTMIADDFKWLRPVNIKERMCDTQIGGGIIKSSLNILLTIMRHREALLYDRFHFLS